MTRPTAHKAEHLIFQLTLLGKAALGVLQLGTALAIWLGAAQKAPAIAEWLVRAELAEDPSDFFASKIVALAQGVPGADMTFYGVYFLLHGLLHFGIVAALLYRATWAHLGAVAVLAAFVVYQLGDWWLAGGAMLLVLSAIDMFVIFVTLQEWRHRR